MRVLVAGAGLAGLSLAYALGRDGHSVVLIEQAPTLRDAGYMIDFFGPGYDVCQAWGLLSALGEIHYPVARLVFLDSRGHEKFRVPYPRLRRLFDDRHFNFMRGDLERLLYDRIGPRVETRFAISVDSVAQDARGVQVKLSDGACERFDLVVGADGVHSALRRLAFGPEDAFTRFLDHYTAAFVVDDASGLDVPTDAFSMMTVPGRQVGLYPIRGGRLATFFLHKDRRRLGSLMPGDAADELRRVYGNLDWVVPALLARCDPARLYFDAVSQIVVPHWNRGRVALVGDACQCVSLLAGQGASLAIAGASAMAAEIAVAGSEAEAALGRYERRMKPLVDRSQEAGRSMARWFVPDDRVRLLLRDIMLRLAGTPIVAPLLKRVLGVGTSRARRRIIPTRP